MRVAFRIPGRRAELDAALEGLTALDAVLIARRGLPRLYRSGVRYHREGVGREEWQNAEQVLVAGAGDCEDLAAYRAAELRVREGEPARARVYRSGLGKWHAIVQRADGRIEDPSRVLGMSRRRRW